jgi:glutathione S-transferase
MPIGFRNIAVAKVSLLDTKAAPKGRLPCLTDDGGTMGDSDAIIAYLKRRYALTIDDGLTDSEQDLGLLVRRTPH